jgi:hypothetical protein
LTENIATYAGLLVATVVVVVANPTAAITAAIINIVFACSWSFYTK